MYMYMYICMLYTCMYMYCNNRNDNDGIHHEVVSPVLVPSDVERPSLVDR